MQKLMYDAMVNAEELAALQEERDILAGVYDLTKVAKRFNTSKIPYQTDAPRPSVKAVKGYDNNAAKAERRRKQRAKRQRKAPSS